MVAYFSRLANKAKKREKQMKKVFIFGAGQIPLHAASYLLSSQAEGEAEVFMYSPHNAKRVEGALEDLNDTAFMRGFSSGWKFRVTDDVEDLKDADFAFFCAGKFPKPHEYDEAAKKGIDDRLLQAVQNISIMESFCDQVLKSAPNVKIFVITNPVDLMSDIAREKLPSNEVYGLGCYLDTCRFKRELHSMPEVIAAQADPAKTKAWIVGHHTGTMFLNRAGFFIDNAEKIKEIEAVIAKALDKTRKRGLEITKLNEGASDKRLNNGAYFAPSVMLAKVMTSCCSDEELVLPLNRPLVREDKLPFTGTAQLLASVKNGKVTPLSLPFNDGDTENLKISMEGQKKARFLLNLKA